MHWRVARWGGTYGGFMLQRHKNPLSAALPALATSGVVLLALAAGCGGSSPGLPAGGEDAGSSADGSSPPADDGALPPPGTDAPAPPPGTDAAQPPPPFVDANGGDGTPMRQQCTNSFGNALTTNYGRLDGYLVAIVSPSTHSCNGDSSHVHLQVSANGGVYDVAIDIYSSQDNPPYVSIDEIQHALVGPAWSEGWHTSLSVDYVASLGVHSTDFTQMQEVPLATKVENDLSLANHVSIYATGYGPTGCHLVHREHPGVDGAVVTNPLSGAPTWMLFHFSNQTF
jgi:hypothetical protein